MADEFKAIGSRVARIDAGDKATGTAKFGADVRRNNALYGKVLRSPYPHAFISNINASRASSLPGVRTVVTADDTPRIAFGAFRRDRYPLAVGKVRFIGEEVAGVAAVDEEAAEEALELIQVDYQPLPAVFDLREATKPGAPRIHELEGNIGYEFHIQRGDVESGFKRAKVVVEETFSTPRVHQCYLEPLACLAEVDLSGRLILTGSFKDIFRIREAVALTTGIPEGKIRLLQTHAGGGFGARGRQSFSFHAIAGLLAKKSGRPVMLVNDRELEFVAGQPRVPSYISLRLGLDMEGKMVAKQADIIADAGAYTGIGPSIMETMSRRADNAYRLANVKNDSRLVYTNQVPTGPYRGFGNPQMTFALESVIDMAAEALGMDPAEVRLRNAAQKDDVTIHGWQLKSCGLTECIRKATDEARWQEKRAAKKFFRGLGVGCMIHVSGRQMSPGFYGSRCLVKLTEDGKLNIISGEGEVGQGWYTVATLIAAEELGVSPEEINIVMPDTDVSPFCHGPFSDRTTLLGGNAVKMAVTDAKRKVVVLAAEMLEARVEDLVVEQGKVQVRGVPERGVTLSQVARYALERRDGQVIYGQGDYDPPSQFPDRKTLYGNISTSYTFAAQVAEVEVDPETGKVTMLNFVGAHDLGRAIFPLGAEGQIEGAAGQGIGWSIMEEMVLENGMTMNPNFLEYRLPTAADMPSVRPILVETIDPFGPFGAKGVAEPGLVPVAPAIANAICHAVGGRVTNLPITPAKLLEVLDGKGRAERG